jgi:hypothetical protein
MNEYALLIDGIFQEIRRYPEKPTNIQHKKVMWYTVAREVGNTFTGLVGSNWVIRTPDPSSLPPVVPTSITPRQCRLILLQQDLLASVEAMIAQQDEATRITWEFASEFKRDDPLLNQLGIALGLTQQQIDEFFIAAAQIP